MQWNIWNCRRYCIRTRTTAASVACCCYGRFRKLPWTTIPYRISNICASISNSAHRADKNERQVWSISVAGSPYLSWALTVHKAQGQTLEKAFVNIGKTEKSAGLTYVALSRCRRSKDLIVSPVTFERLTKIKDKPAFKRKVKEFRRLSALSKATLSVDKLKIIQATKLKKQAITNLVNGHSRFK